MRFHLFTFNEEFFTNDYGKNRDLDIHLKNQNVPSKEKKQYRETSRENCCMDYKKTEHDCNIAPLLIIHADNLLLLSVGEKIDCILLLN
jgi:hypothetical protein